VPADEPLVVIHRRRVAHCLMYLPAGQISLRSFHRGHQTDHMVNGGSVSFSPADGHGRTLVGEHNPAHDYFTLLIPRRAVGLLAESEGVIWTSDDLNCFFSLDDAVLRWCMERLSAQRGCIPTPLCGSFTLATIPRLRREGWKKQRHSSRRMAVP
jgi:hypothetical protein